MKRWSPLLLYLTLAAEWVPTAGGPHPGPARWLNGELSRHASRRLTQDDDECKAYASRGAPCTCAEAGCKAFLLGDRVCDATCNNTACLYDGGDCNVSPPLFDDVMLSFFEQRPSPGERLPGSRMPILAEVNLARLQRSVTLNISTSNSTFVIVDSLELEEKNKEGREYRVVRGHVRNDLLSSVTFAVTDDLVCGVINMANGDLVQMLQMPDDAFAPGWVEVRYKPYRYEALPRQDDARAPQEEEDICKLRETQCDVRSLRLVDEGNVADLGVAYTEEAMRKLGGRRRIEGLVMVAVEKTNEALQNSGPKLQLRLAAMRVWEGSRAQGVGELLSESTEKLRDWRDQEGLDMVLVVAGLPEQDVCGQAFVWQDPRRILTKPFAVVSHSCLGTERFTVAHELGHIFGCRHNPPDTSSGVEEDRGAGSAGGRGPGAEDEASYGFWTPSKRDIMHEDCPEGFQACRVPPRIAAYSGPQVLDDGMTVLGTFGASNCAGAVHKRTAWLVNLRQRTPPEPAAADTRGRRPSTETALDDVLMPPAPEPEDDQPPAPRDDGLIALCAGVAASWKPEWASDLESEPPQLVPPPSNLAELQAEVNALADVDGGAPWTLIDLQGHSLAEEGPAPVNGMYFLGGNRVVVRNGTLVLPAGASLVLRGDGVLLLDSLRFLRIGHRWRSSREKRDLVQVEGAARRAWLNNCTFAGVRGTHEMWRYIAGDNDRAGLAVLGKAQVWLSCSQVVFRAGDVAARVRQRGSVLRAAGSSFVRARRFAVKATEFALVELHTCRMQGTEFSKNVEKPYPADVGGSGHGLMVRQGATAWVTNSVLSGNQRNGVWSADAGTQVLLINTTSSTNGEDGAEARWGAALYIMDSRLASNANLGVDVHDGGTTATLVASTVEANGNRGVEANRGAVVQLISCELLRHPDIALIMRGGSAQLLSSHVHSNAVGVRVEGTSTATLANCVVQNNRGAAASDRDLQVVAKAAVQVVGCTIGQQQLASRAFTAA